MNTVTHICKSCEVRRLGSLYSVCSKGVGKAADFGPPTLVTVSGPTMKATLWALSVSSGKLCAELKVPAILFLHLILLLSVQLSEFPLVGWWPLLGLLSADWLSTDSCCGRIWESVTERDKPSDFLTSLAWFPFPSLLFVCPPFKFCPFKLWVPVPACSSSDSPSDDASSGFSCSWSIDSDKLLEFLLWGALVMWSDCPLWLTSGIKRSRESMAPLAGVSSSSSLSSEKAASDCLRLYGACNRIVWSCDDLWLAEIKVSTPWVKKPNLGIQSG